MLTDEHSVSAACRKVCDIIKSNEQKLIYNNNSTNTKRRDKLLFSHFNFDATPVLVSFGERVVPCAKDPKSRFVELPRGVSCVAISKCFRSQFA